MSDIRYLKGDATDPKERGNKIIIHVCNDVGGWGKGFVMALSKKWKKPEEKYIDWYESGDDFELGAVQFVQVEDDLFVANMIAQHNLTPDNQGKPPIRYQALDKALIKVAEKAKELQASVHLPRIGTGLAGGKWQEIEPLLTNRLSDHGIEVTVYDFDK